MLSERALSATFCLRSQLTMREFLEIVVLPLLLRLAAEGVASGVFEPDGRVDPRRVCPGRALGVGIVSALNPLRQKGQGGDFFRVASLDVLPEDGTPRKFPIIADRRDAWTLFPNEPIGSVWLRRVGPKAVKALCVVCPHAGCFIGYDAKSEPVSLPLPPGLLRPGRRAHGRLLAEPSRHGRARRASRFATATRSGSNSRISKPVPLTRLRKHESLL